MSEIDLRRIEKIEEIKELLHNQKGVEVLYEEFALIPAETVVHTEELKSEIERLKELVYKDELTKVLNRRGFMERYEPLFKQALYKKQNPESHRNVEVSGFSILFADGDNFKSINDKYGHDEGDSVLKGIANCLKESIRGIDAVGRFGGEEFVVCLLGANEEEAYKKAEEMRLLISQKVKISKNSEHVVTASFGIASLDQSDADTLDEIIAYADQAMYEAKANRGKNNSVRYSELKNTH